VRSQGVAVLRRRIYLLLALKCRPISFAAYMQRTAGTGCISPNSSPCTPSFDLVSWSAFPPLLLFINFPSLSLEMSPRTEFLSSSPPVLPFPPNVPSRRSRSFLRVFSPWGYALPHLSSLTSHSLLFFGPPSLSLPR